MKLSLSYYILPRKLVSFVSTLAVLVLTTHCADGRRPTGEPLLTTQVGASSWDLWIAPDPPKQNGTTIWLQVEGSAAKPVVGADVQSGYLMPAMGAMAEMRGKASVSEIGSGLYRLTFEFPMEGTWTLNVRVEAEGGRGEAEYSLTTGASGLRELGAVTAASEARVTDSEKQAVLSLDPVDLPDSALEALRMAFSAYEESRRLLATDELDGLSARASRLARSLTLAREALPESTATELALSLEEASLASETMASALDLREARAAFGEVSRFLILLASADPRLVEDWHVFECPMTDTFPKWMQPSADNKNPFMGPAMSTCGTASDWTVPAPEGLREVEAHVDAVHGGDIAHYTCSMHPSVEKEGPGTCPICSMNLVPVTREELQTGVIRVDAQRRQEIGVRTSPVEVRPLTVTIRTVGNVTYDETRLTEVSLKNSGWIERLFVEETGQPVQRGQTLLTLYSPVLLAAQEEFLAALDSQEAARQSEAPGRADYLVDASRRRLSLWDLSPDQIEEIARSREPIESLGIASPASGYVVEKNVVEGAAVQSGQTLYRIANLDRVWIDAEVYESELPLVEVGQQATVSFPYLPGRTFSARVGYIHPYLERGSRTGTVRLELPNPGLELKLDMYANVVLESEQGEEIVVPEEAVIYAGPRRLVFLDLGEGRLEPRTVELGVKSGDSYQVLAGLAPGDVVVTSGNFLIAAESRLKSATEDW